MTINVDAPTKSISLAFTDGEWATLAEANRRQSGVFATLVTDWLKNIRSSMMEEDRKILFQRFSSLTENQITQIKQILGL